MMSGIWLSRAPALRASRTHVVSYLTTAIYVFVLRTITLSCFGWARATKSKPAATISKPSATKSKSPFPPSIEACQWVSLDSGSRGPLIRRLDRAPRRSRGVTGRRSFSTLQAIARFLLFVNNLAPLYSHGGPADLTASPALHVWTTRAKPRKHSLPLSPVAPRAAIDGASGGVRLRFNTRSDENRSRAA